MIWRALEKKLPSLVLLDITVCELLAPEEETQEEKQLVV
jgi:hypothetical protein